MSDQLHALAALPPGERAPGTHWIGGWVEQNSNALKVPRQSPLGLLIQARLRDGKALGDALFYKQRKESERGFLLRKVGF
jgi:hypothetical protein